MAIHERQIAQTFTVPPLGPGFAGPRHMASAVFLNDMPEATDPFILLADDHVSGSGPFGAAHPHAGLETVTLILLGDVYDRDEGVLREGDVEWMTAGRGIIHNEAVETRGDMRLLQLWLRMPDEARNAPPRVQRIHRDSAPVRHEPGATVRVYSGVSGGAVSNTLNHVPVTLIDVTLDAGAVLNQELPSAYNGFLLVLEGAVHGGGDPVMITAGQVSWLDRPLTSGASTIRLEGGGDGGRVLLCAGMPQKTPLVTHGPFVAISREELAQHFHNYQSGSFARAADLVQKG